jgi:hypothetical protein
MSSHWYVKYLETNSGGLTQEEYDRKYGHPELYETEEVKRAREPGRQAAQEHEESIMKSIRVFKIKMRMRRNYSIAMGLNGKMIPMDVMRIIILM